MQLTDLLATAIATTPKHLKALKEMGIETVADLLAYYPRTHADVSDVRDVREVVVGETNTVAGTLANLRSMYVRSGKTMITAKLIGRSPVIPNAFRDPDGIASLSSTARNDNPTSALDLLWFNQAWVTRALKNDDEIVVTGKVRMNGPRHQLLVGTFEKVSEELLHTGRLVPVYRQHGSAITSKWLREKLFPLIELTKKLSDPLPPEILERQDLMPFAAAVKGIHFPGSEEEKNVARERLAFDELFFLQLGALRRKWDWQLANTGDGMPIPLDENLVREFTATLPFTLTHAQKISAYEILRDLERRVPMNRLLEGDVGSGKTIVAALALFLAVRAGYQAALLAPTEILAAQHFRNFLKVLHPLGLRIELLTGSTTTAAKKDIAGRLKAGQLDVVVGTHALLEEKIQFNNLALTVVDEQHRFGVAQRALLKKDGTPHVLAMTATPIPRTLALTIFGDQDVSIIDELPPGRAPIVTRIVPAARREDSYRWIESEVAKGRQVFVVCPLVEESEALEVKSAKAEYARLRDEVFPNLTVGLLHGRMKPREKDAVMAAFAANEVSVLVSTSVIEVGIDVPNATIMLIEAADRFGLAQLHQFRGRVGRGVHQSYCFLFAETESPTAIERLRAMESFIDGFKLAEIDLAMRGPGEVFGTRQSGIPDFRIARFSDVDLIKRSRAEAERLLIDDSDLKKHPSIAAQLAAIEARSRED